MPTNTPWGPAQDSKQHAVGIMEYSCAGHGGFHVTAKRLAQMPEYFRNKDGWYEEDCEYAMVVLSFPDVFTAEMSGFAKDSLRSYYPDQYEAHFGVVLQPGESREKDDRAFKAATVDKYVVTSACGSWAKNVPEGMVGVTAARGRDGDQKRFLVPDAEYNARHFVVDPTRHEEVQTDFQ